jgi:hypothetical protein
VAVVVEHDSHDVSADTLFYQKYSYWHHWYYRCHPPLRLDWSDALNKLAQVDRLAPRTLVLVGRHYLIGLAKIPKQKQNENHHVDSYSMMARDCIDSNRYRYKERMTRTLLAVENDPLAVDLYEHGRGSSSDPPRRTSRDDCACQRLAEAIWRETPSCDFDWDDYSMMTVAVAVAVRTRRTPPRGSGDCYSRMLHYCDRYHWTDDDSGWGYCRCDSSFLSWIYYL